MVGVWKKGPGADLFRALEGALGGIPILAEDLGVITPDVTALRDRQYADQIRNVVPVVNATSVNATYQEATTTPLRANGPGPVERKGPVSLSTCAAPRRPSGS